MKTLVIYTSQTGFTKRYAEWISEELNADIYDLKDVKKKTNDFLKHMKLLSMQDGVWREWL